MTALPVLYSFRRCPYAMRARLALAVSGQVCELREVVLRNKPQGLLQASPKGTVPVLVLPGGQVLEQSLDIMLWALAQNDPEGWLTPSDGTMADMLALIAECDGPFKQALDRCKYPSRYPEADPALARTQAGSLGITCSNNGLACQWASQACKRGHGWALHQTSSMPANCRTKGAMAMSARAARLPYRQAWWVSLVSSVCSQSAAWARARVGSASG